MLQEKKTQVKKIESNKRHLSSLWAIQNILHDYKFVGTSCSRTFYKSKTFIIVPLYGEDESH